MLSIYFALGVFLLIAARRPSAHRSLILFAGWANLAHALVMSAQSIGLRAERGDLLNAAAICVLVGLSLIALATPKHAAVRNFAVYVVSRA